MLAIDAGSLEVILRPVTRRNGRKRVNLPGPPWKNSVWGKSRAMPKIDIRIPPSRAGEAQVPSAVLRLGTLTGPAVAPRSRSGT